jgi:hypothetical protein
MWSYQQDTLLKSLNVVQSSKESGVDVAHKRNSMGTSFRSNKGLMALTAKSEVASAAEALCLVLIPVRRSMQSGLKLKKP